jgi:hypothetical protein
MKKQLLLICFSVTFIISAQTTEDRNKIVQNYDLEKIYDSIEKLNQEEAEKQQIIDAFIAINSETKKNIYKDGVHYVLVDIIENKPIYVGPDNAKCAVATGTDELYPNGDLGLNLEGDGMTIGVWEIDYPLKTHVEFVDDIGNSRISTPDTTNPNPVYDFHATHVNGTIGAKGDNSSAKGMAPKSTIVAYNQNNDVEESLEEHIDSGMLVSNHSYGVYIISQTTGDQQVPDWYMGCYVTNARNWDQNHVNAPYYLMVTSGGNSGNVNYDNGLAPGLDKLTSSTISKNNLVVANADVSVNFSPLGYSITGASMNSSSSQGPTDDGRIKPDITGRGTNVNSCDPFSNPPYGLATGTSMAGPNVAGSLLLLQEHYRDLNPTYMRSSTLKALACHTSTDDADNPNVTSITYPGPDPFWGWGLLNTEFAAQTITDAQSGGTIIEENTLNNAQTYSFTVNVSNSEKLMATICWTDPVASSRNSEAECTQAPVLINDLDLRIYDSSGLEYKPWKLDLTNLPNAIKGDNTVDNIERVEVDAPSGQYTITISHKGTLSGIPFGSGTQDYALIVTGANQSLSTGNGDLSNLMVWPNPANDMINFQYPSTEDKKTTITLLDLRGRIVYENNFSSENGIVKGQIETSRFTKGVYILNLKQGSATMNQKVILK